MPGWAGTRSGVVGLRCGPGGALEVVGDVVILPGRERHHPDRLLQGVHQVVIPPLAGEFVEVSDDPADVGLGDAGRGDDLQDRGVAGGTYALVWAEDLLGQSLAGSEPGHDDLDVRSRTEAARPDQGPGQVQD